MDGADEAPKKAIKVHLSLTVQGFSSFVRGEGRARRSIELGILSEYEMQKISPRGSEYILQIPYETDEELDRIIDEMLGEAGSVADDYDCFIEADAKAMDGSERFWT